MEELLIPLHLLVGSFQEELIQEESIILYQVQIEEEQINLRQMKKKFNMEPAKSMIQILLKIQTFRKKFIVK